MTQTFLQILPIEIRGQIYEEVFTSPTGLIYLKAEWGLMMTPQYTITGDEDGRSEQIQMSFLRTCKQIYHECTDMVWKCNTLEVGRLVGRPDLSALHQGIKSKVQSIQFQFHFLENQMIYNTSRSRGRGPVMVDGLSMMLKKWRKFLRWAS